MSASDNTWNVQGYAWKLRYRATAFASLERVFGTKETFAAQLMQESLGTGLSHSQQVLLIWAGQRGTDPKVTRQAVEHRLTVMGDKGMAYLLAWATAEFCKTVLLMMEAQVQAMDRPGDEDEWQQ